MRSVRVRLWVTVLLLLGFAGIFTHELLPGHEHHGGEPCQICVQWSHQVAVEGQAPDLPAVPTNFEMEAPASAPQPGHFFEVHFRQRGPPRPLPVL